MSDFALDDARRLENRGGGKLEGISTSRKRFGRTARPGKRKVRPEWNCVDA